MTRSKAEVSPSYYVTRSGKTTHERGMVEGKAYGVCIEVGD